MSPERRAPRVVASSDCERCRDGWITQPANTLSSLAYVVAGAHLGRQASRRPSGGSTAVVEGAYAAAVAGVGFGSMAYHGPGGAWGRWLHDAALVSLAAVATIGEGPPRWALITSIPVWSAGVTFQVLGRTGGPLCRPGSRFQPHAAWHICSALGLWLRGQPR